MQFEVIPAVDLKGGRCVQLVQGVKNNEAVSLDDPIGMANHWICEGARRLHVIDLDGAFSEEKKNRDIIQEIVRKSDVPVQVGGGIRSFEDASQLLEMGVDRVIMGTSAVKNISLVYKLSEEFSKERIMIALDTKGGEVKIDGWTKGSGLGPKELAIKFKNDVGSFLFTNIDVEGLLSGIKIDPIKDLVSSVNIPVIVAGGISHIEDIKKVKSTGSGGVVIGTAIYKKTIVFKDALKISND